MDTKSFQLYINAGVEFRSIVGLEAGSIVFIPPGWHVWCQNGSTGGSAACKDLTQFEYHCIPAGSLTQSSLALENLKSQLELMEPSCESEESKLEIKIATTVQTDLQTRVKKDQFSATFPTRHAEPVGGIESSPLASPVRPCFTASASPSPETRPETLGQASICC